MNESKRYFDKANSSESYSELYMISFYLAGVIGSILINYIIHQFIPEDSTLHSHHYGPPPGTACKESTKNCNPLSSQNDESSPLLQNGHMTSMMYNGSNDDLPRDSTSLNDIRDFCEEDRSNEHSTFVEVDVDESISPVLKPFRYLHENDQSNYLLEQEKSQLMRIGIQTALAISIHKFPEGLVTFISSKVSSSVGVALFFAIALHNISEGFTMALPLYLATQSRAKSFLYASLLGGLSQPLGALVGWLLLKRSEAECWNHDFVYGALFGATGGLMAVICIQ
ncbi:7274_t:CDS:2, partial [Acaulospora colombiana]